MKTKALLLGAVTAVLCLNARAEIEKDLGQSLPYLRVTDARADLPAVLGAIEHRPVFVLDLRSVLADPHFAAALQSALDKKPGPHALRIILINATTDPSVIEALDTDYQDVVTIGPKSPVTKPDMPVNVSEADDRKAFDALANGTPVEKLITDSRDKRRYDEAKLVHDHANGVTPSDAELPPDAEDDAVIAEPTDGKKPAETKKEPEPLLDLVLERAVQLHRSLLALKKV